VVQHVRSGNLLLPVVNFTATLDEDIFALLVYNSIGTTW
jgi:hypothetical protein